jgi:hypothetical protein
LEKDYNVSTYNVLVEWQTGESKYEPLDLIRSDDPVTCAENAMEREHFNTPGWKRYNRYAINPKKMEPMINQAKMKSYLWEPFWKLCVLVPQTHAQADEIDLNEIAFINEGKGGTAPTG